MANHILVTRPDHDLTTKYISAWANGYIDDFIFLFLDRFKTKPLLDPLASSFLKPANAIPIALIKGHSVSNAVLKARQEFTRNIRSLLRSDTNQDDYSTVRYLVWNMQNLKAYGELNKKI